MKFSQAQKENIQIDYGIVYKNYGETDSSLMGPSKGGGEFNVDVKIRDIEHDGANGKEKGMQVVEEVNASLKVSVKDTSIQTLALAMPWATLTGDGTVENPYKLICENINIGAIADAAYLKNVTMFAKTLGGDYRKISLYNALHEGKFSFKAAPKGEAEIELEFNAHWDPLDDAADLYDIETITNINGDVTKPTVITTPADGVAAINIANNLTAVFSEAIRQQDIIADNFMLIKASDGSIVSGSLTYDSGSKTVTFNPTVDLSAGTPYIWTIARVRDLAGNVMVPVVNNFTTA